MSNIPTTTVDIPEAYLSIAERILELSKAATIGPWRRDPRGKFIWGPDDFMVADQYPNSDALCNIRGWSDLTGHGGPHVNDHAKAIEAQKANGDLIAEYRTLAPDLAQMMIELHNRIVQCGKEFREEKFNVG